MIHPEDIASPALETGQISELCQRVLRPLSMRLACGEQGWTHVAVDREIWFPDGERQKIEFTAERDDDSGDLEFALYTSLAVPFDGTWSSSAIYQRLSKASVWAQDQDEHGGAVIDEYPAEDDATEALDTETPIGFWARDASYTLKLPHSRRLSPRATRDVSFTFFDEDFDPIDGEVAANPHHTPENALVDIERLYRFGEVMLLQGEAEADLVSMTVYDANFVLNILKGVGLVRRNCKPIT